MGERLISSCLWQELAPQTPALVIAGGSSNSGKTCTTLALTSALMQRGQRPLLCKAGPDFIDARYLSVWSKSPALNLDPWMAGKVGMRRLLTKLSQMAASYDALIIEGCMGLFDGGDNSTSFLAELLGCPVLLLVNAHGMAESAGCVVRGFLAEAKLHPRLRLLGYAFTHVGGARHARYLERAADRLALDYDVPCLGFLYREEAPLLASRHLGLVDVTESMPTLSHASLAAWCEKGLNWDALLALMGWDTPGPKQALSESDLKHNVPSLGPANFFVPAKQPDQPKVTIAIAFDEAFSFCYADLPAVLMELGAKIVFFSPCTDSAPPPCEAMIFPGGYPERFAVTLASNVAMRQCLRECASSGMPILAECGGLIYLFDGIESQDGDFYPMVGALKGVAKIMPRVQALGYRSCVFQSVKGSLPILVRGHEFHYGQVLEGRGGASLGDSEQPVPLWEMYDYDANYLGQHGKRTHNIMASWLHIYPQGGRVFFAKWLRFVRSRVGQ